MSKCYNTQNDLLLENILEWYQSTNNLQLMLNIINGESKISLRIVDWFATNYAKKNFTNFFISKKGRQERFKVYDDYKLKLKAYSKKRFDPSCRWDRINIPYKNDKYIQTTIGQLNFFKWAIENNIINYIENNYEIIEQDMNNRNSNSKKNKDKMKDNKRKKREELSVSASKSIKKEDIEIIVSFD
jgi:hypothetical protein